MYELVIQIGIPKFMLREAVPLAISLAIAEVFYKFHSFTLETLAFLATWYLISAAVSVLSRSRAK